MVPFLIACAGLSVLCLGWMFRPLRSGKAFYALSIVCALAAIGLYFTLGRPDLPAQPTGRDVIAERRKLMKQEFEFQTRLKKNPDDADALIRLAAIHVLQSRVDDETIRMLDRAAVLTPGDKRHRMVRGMIQGAPKAPVKESD